MNSVYVTKSRNVVVRLSLGVSILAIQAANLALNGLLCLTAPRSSQISLSSITYVIDLCHR